LVEDEADLNDLREKVDKDLTIIEGLIDSKKPLEPEKPKEDIEKLKAELKIYKNAFDYMFPTTNEEDKAITVSQ